MKFKEVKLPSGAILKIAPSPFAEAKALYQAFLKEMKGVSVGGKNELGDIIKNLFCSGFSSPEIESCLAKCMARCLYKDGPIELKIDDDTFEPVHRREDYTLVCFEVAQENISPFGKSLMQLYFHLLASAESTPASRSETKSS